MLGKGPAKKVTIYVNEDTQYRHGAIYEAILTYLMHKGVAGATATKAMAGFGAHQVMHTPKIEVLAEHLPIRIEFVETAQKVEEVLPTLYDMLADGLIEVQDTMVVRVANKDKPKGEPRHPHEVRRSRAKLMRIIIGEADKWAEEPLYEAIVNRLRMMDIAGATVYRGILGYGAKGHTHKQSFWHLVKDLPILISVVDTEEKLNTAISVLQEMIEDGLIVISDVEAVRLVHSPAAAEVRDANSETS